MKEFYKVTRQDDDSVKASIEKDVVTLTVESDDDHEYVVLHQSDFDGIIWNYLEFIGRLNMIGGYTMKIKAINELTREDWARLAWWFVLITGVAMIVDLILAWVFIQFNILF